MFIALLGNIFMVQRPITLDCTFGHLPFYGKPTWICAVSVAYATNANLSAVHLASGFYMYTLSSVTRLS